MKIRRLTFRRTRKALAAYDAYDCAFIENLSTLTTAEAIRRFAVLKELGAAVGRAFGEDTSDRNSIETCAQVVRPGPWLRALVVQSPRSR
jgi:hypothetical protein